MTRTKKSALYITSPVALARSFGTLGARGLAWLVTLACLAAAGIAWGQEPEEEPEEKESRPPVLIVTADTGTAGRDVSGSLNKLRQYSSPPASWFLKELTLQPLTVPYEGHGFVALRGYGSDALRADAEIGLNGARHRLWVSAERNRFMANTPQIVEQSNRKGDALNYSYLFGPNIGWTIRLATQNVNRHFEAPREALRTRTREWHVSAFGSAGQGSLGASLTDARYYDRMLTQPDTGTQTLRVEGLWSPGPEGDLSGAVTSRSMDRAGVGAGRVNNVALAGNLSLGWAGDLSIRGQTEHASWPTVESARVTDRRSVETVLSSRYRSIGMVLRWQYREAERVRGDGDYLDVPKWTTFAARVTSRLTRLARLTVRGTTERMWQRPQMVTTDTRSAIWDSRDNFEAKVDIGGDTASGYASWRLRRNGNVARGTNVTNGTACAGATLTVSPGLEVFADYALETWRGRSEDMAYPTLGHFMPDSRVASLGVSYAPDAVSHLWAGYTVAATDNDNPQLVRDGNTEARYFTASYRRRFGLGRELSLTIAPWTYRDRTDPTMNMTATTLVLSGKMRF